MTLCNADYPFLVLFYARDPKSQKGGSAMSCTVTIDWKFVAAAGGSVAACIFAWKMSPEQATEVTIHAIDACKENAEDQIDC